MVFSFPFGLQPGCCGLFLLTPTHVRRLGSDIPLEQLNRAAATSDQNESPSKTRGPMKKRRIMRLRQSRLHASGSTHWGCGITEPAHDSPGITRGGPRRIPSTSAGHVALLSRPHTPRSSTDRELADRSPNCASPWLASGVMRQHRTASPGGQRK